MTLDNRQSEHSNSVNSISTGEPELVNIAVSGPSGKRYQVPATLKLEIFDDAKQKALINQLNPIVPQVFAALQWCLLKPLCTGLTYSEIRAQMLKPGESQELGNVRKRVLTKDVLVEDSYAMAKDLFTLGEENVKAINEKIRTLSLICSLMVPLFSGFLLPRFPWPAAFVPLALIILCVFVLFINLGPNWRAAPQYSDDTHLGEGMKNLLTADYLVAAHRNGYLNDYLIVIYKAARKLFTLGLIALGVLVAVCKPDQALTPTQNGPQQAVPQNVPPQDSVKAQQAPDSAAHREHISDSLTKTDPVPSQIKK